MVFLDEKLKEQLWDNEVLKRLGLLDKLDNKLQIAERRIQHPDMKIALQKLPHVRQLINIYFPKRMDN